MGQVADRLVNQMNDIRYAQNVPPVDGGTVSIPKSDIQHIYNRRVKKQNYTPKDVTDTLYDAVFNKKSKVIPGKTPEKQVMLNTFSKRPNAAIVGRNLQDNNIFIRTGYHPDNIDNLSKSYLKNGLGGRLNPPSVTELNNSSGSILSTLQAASTTANVSSPTPKVKPNLLFYTNSLVPEAVDNGLDYFSQW